MRYLSILSVLLALLATAVFFFGMFASKGAPQQSVVVGAACFFGILARLAQASQHNQDRMAQERDIFNKTKAFKEVPELIVPQIITKE